MKRRGGKAAETGPSNTEEQIKKARTHQYDSGDDLEGIIRQSPAVSPRGKDEICLVHSPVLIQPITVFVEDYERLTDGKWLSDSVVNSLVYCQANAYWESVSDFENPDLNLLSIVPSWVYRDYVQNKMNATTNPTRVYITPSERQEWPFRPYIFFVINVNESHWISALLCNAVNVEKPAQVNRANDIRHKKNGACLLVLDSLGGHHPNVANMIQSFVEDVMLPFWDEDFHVQNLPVFHPRIPGQKNSSDCGLFPAHYLRVFMQDPAAYLRHCTEEDLMSGTSSEVWHAADIPHLRADARRLIEGIARMYRAFVVQHELHGRHPIPSCISDIGHPTQKVMYLRYGGFCHPGLDEADVAAQAKAATTPVIDIHAETVDMGRTNGSTDSAGEDGVEGDIDAVLPDENNADTEGAVGTEDVGTRQGAGHTNETGVGNSELNNITDTKGDIDDIEDIDEYDIKGNNNDSIEDINEGATQTGTLSNNRGDVDLTTSEIGSSNPNAFSDPISDSASDDSNREFNDPNDISGATLVNDFDITTDDVVKTREKLSPAPGHNQTVYVRFPPLSPSTVVSILPTQLPLL